jgi:hypothetical protein
MRIRMLRRPRENCIDGVRLDRFEPGLEYEVGSSLAALFFAEGWAEPIPFGFDEEEPAVPASGVGAALPPRKRPRNLMRERYSSGVERLDTARDSRRASKSRTRTPPKRPQSR